MKKNTDIIKENQQVYFKVNAGVNEYVECGIVRSIDADFDGVMTAYIETLSPDCYASEFFTLSVCDVYTVGSEEGRELADEYSSMTKYEPAKCVNQWNALSIWHPEPGRCVVGLTRSQDGGLDAILCMAQELEQKGCVYWAYVPDFHGLMVAPAEETDFM